MPIYEFSCNSCHEKTNLFAKSMSEPLSPVCLSCGSKDLTRLISSFAYHKPLQSIWEESGDPDKPGPNYYKDPRNIGRWAEKRFRELGQEISPQVQEMIQAAREGDLPDSIEDLQPGVGEA